MGKVIQFNLKRGEVVDCTHSERANGICLHCNDDCPHPETENGVCIYCGTDPSGDAPDYSKQRCPVCDEVVSGCLIGGAFCFDHICRGHK